jgi:hypothetical protein
MMAFDNALAQIDWSALTHAYGPADDVPGALRALATGDADACHQAFSELWGNIHHQGTVYEATCHAVPLLIALLERPHFPDRPQLLALLACLGSGSSYHDVHGPDGGSSPAQHQATVDAELSHVQRATDAVAAALPLYVELASTGAADLRPWAVFVISKLPLTATAACCISDRLAQETAPVALASTVRAAGDMGLMETVPRVAALAACDQDIVAWSAAVALTQLDVTRLTPPAVARLVACVAADADGYTELPQCVIDEVAAYRSHEALRCIPIGSEMAAVAATQLAAALHRCEELSCPEVGSAYLAMFFTPAGEPRRTVDAEQHRALSVILRVDSFWECQTMQLVRAGYLRRYGLPESRDALARLCQTRLQ